MKLGQSVSFVDSGILSSVGAALWKDKHYKASSLPPILDGSFVGSVPYEIPKESDIALDIETASTVFIALHHNAILDNLTNWLDTNDWHRIDDEEIIYSNENGTELLKEIWFKEIFKTQDLTFTVESEAITLAVFIKPGK